VRATRKVLPSASITLATGAALLLAACAGKEPPAAAAPPAGGAPATEAAPAAPAATTAAVAPDAAPTGPPATATAAVDRAWTPEALEELLAPVALYPDPVLSQVLIASTNPQEVLDAGNWLIANEALKGKALDAAAATVGFTPPVRALVQFPETVDMMCLQMAWTTELGQAFTADQAGVLDAVQRLRAQAVSVGNLSSSDRLKVEKTVQEQKEVIVLKPPKPEVVYVPQYDPVAAYAPAPAAATTAVPVASPATTVTTEKKEGHSTGALVATGVLAFGAGILVNELFDDDDDYRRYGYYYPNYGYGGMPYYPPYPYRPVYGGGFYPGSSYVRPPGYNSGFQNNGTIIINNNRPGNGYWDRYGNGSRPGSTGYRPRAVSSPITAARGNRPELRELNQRAPRPRPADIRPPAPNLTASNWRGQSSYAGANRAARPTSKAGAPSDPRERIAAATPGYSQPAAARPAAKAPAAKVPTAARGPAGKDAVRAPAKVQGSYAGARPAMPERPVPTARPVPMSRPSPADRSAMPANRPAPSFGYNAGSSRDTAMSGMARGGSAERAASARGRQSMPQGAGAAAGAARRQAR
jgi:hypothetical protein